MRKSKLILLSAIIALMALGVGLYGCGGGGGLGGGGFGGGAGNTPVINGNIQALVDGTWEDAGTTDANGAVKITAKPWSSYPVILKVSGATGFAGTMYTPLMSSGQRNIYFSAFSTMWVKYAAQATVKAYGDLTTADLNNARGAVQSVYALLTNDADAAGFMSVNPLTDATMALVHKILDSDTGAASNGYANFDAVMDAMTGADGAGNGLDGNGPLTAIINNFASVTSVATLQDLIEQVSSSTTAQAELAAAYGSISAGALATAGTTLQNNVTANGDISAGLVGEITVDGVRDGSNAAYTQAALFFPSDAASQVAPYDFYTVQLTVYDSSSPAVPLVGATVSADSAVGTTEVLDGWAGSATTVTDGSGQVWVRLNAPGTDQTVGTSGTVTITVTNGSSTGKVQAYYEFFDNTVLNPSSVALVDTPSGANGQLLVLDTVQGSGLRTTDTFGLVATVNGLGAGTFAADSYKVNFYPPAGTKFFDGTNILDNYLAAIPGGTASGGTVNLTTALSSAPNVYVGSLSIGSSGSFSAVITDNDGNPLSPRIDDASSVYYQVDDPDRVKAIQLEIGNTADGAPTAWGTLQQETGLVDGNTATINDLRATFKTWDTFANAAAFDNTWATGKTDSMYLTTDLGEPGFTADASADGNYDVDTVGLTAAMLASGTGAGTVSNSGAYDTSYTVSMTTGDDNKDAITLQWDYTEGTTDKTMYSNPVYFQALP